MPVLRRGRRTRRRAGVRFDAQAEQVYRAESRLDEAATDPVRCEERVERRTERHDQVVFHEAIGEGHSSIYAVLATQSVQPRQFVQVGLAEPADVRQVAETGDRI